MTIISDEPSTVEKQPWDMTPAELAEAVGAQDISIHATAERIYVDNVNELIAHVNFTLSKVVESRSRLAEALPGRAIGFGYDADADKFYLLTLFQVAGVGEVPEEVMDAE